MTFSSSGVRLWGCGCIMGSLEDQDLVFLKVRFLKMRDLFQMTGIGSMCCGVSFMFGIRMMSAVFVGS